jgi:hypothetical protein
VPISAFRESILLGSWHSLALSYCFMATLVPVDFLVARLTTPKAPWPMRTEMSYSLRVVLFGQLSETGVKFLQLALLFPCELAL